MKRTVQIKISPGTHGLRNVSKASKALLIPVWNSTEFANNGNGKNANA